MNHPNHELLLRHGFTCTIQDGTAEYRHPALPRLWTYVRDHDSYAAQKAVEYALNKLEKGQDNGKRN